MKFKSYGILLILGGLLLFIAIQARTGIFRRDASKERPANKYMREVLENPRLTEADATVLRTQYADAIVTPSGLRYVVRQTGEGSVPPFGAEISVHYEAYLLDGTKLESTLDTGTPRHLRVGVDAAIKGWEEALRTMKVGEKRTLLVPWWIGYGESGGGRIPKKATIRFEVELLEIRSSLPAPAKSDRD